MHVSLTPELEVLIQEKVASGLYGDASEVVREALRFMNNNEEWIRQMKLAQLRAKLAEGEHDLDEGRFSQLSAEDLADHLQTIKQRVVARMRHN